MLTTWKKSYDQAIHILKRRDITLQTEVCLVKAVFFLVVMYGCELGYKESWAPKDWCFWTVVLEKTLYSSLDCTEFKAVNSKENKSWIFIERTDAEAESPNFGHLMQRGDSLEKTLVLGKTEGRRRRVDGGWDGWKASPAQWTWVWASSRSWSAAIHGITECQTRLRDWAELIFCCLATTATTIKAESCHLLPHECT